MKRPALNEIPLTEVFPLRAAELIMTISPGQWDDILQATYEQGWTLLEVDQDEQPVKAYRK